MNNNNPKFHPETGELQVPLTNNPEAEPLVIDSRRVLSDDDIGTGIYIRAKGVDGKWCTTDICELEKSSLVRWLKSRGGDNKWAESTVCLLLGHPYEN